MEVGLDPGGIVLDGDELPARKRVQQPPPTFRPMSIVAKRSPISTTAELLYYNINITSFSVYTVPSANFNNFELIPSPISFI